MKLAVKPLVVSTAALGLIFGVAQNAQAALITGVTVSTNMGSYAIAYNIENTVNGKGLPGDIPSLTGNHAAGEASNQWASAANTLTGQITFNLNGKYNLAGFSFWNFNGASNAGIKDVTVKYSTDGTTFTTITGSPTQFAIGANGAAEPPEQFSFSPVVASHVQFVVSSNYGSAAGSGFSEAQFDGTPAQPQSVPEPSSLLALLAFGLGGVSLRKRL